MGLVSSLAAHHRADLGQLRFRLIAVPLKVLDAYRLDDFAEHFEDLIESDREYDAIMLRCSEEPEWSWENAEDRYLIARTYVEVFRTGRSVGPIMVDFSISGLTTVHIVDGHHRTQAAHEARMAEIAAYEVVLPELGNR